MLSAWLDHGKRSFYRAVNGICGRIDRMASEEVILELIKTKCLPILLYGPVSPLSKSKTNLRSIVFVCLFFLYHSLMNKVAHYI